MANTSIKVVDDTPSQVVHELRRQFNALLDLMEDAADLAAIQTGLSDGTVDKVVVAPELAVPPRFPTP